MTIALVTGGNRGIGRAVVEALSEQGIDTIIGSRRKEDGAQAANDVGRNSSFVELDVTDSVSVQNAAAFIESEVGSLDILINNAGILPEATNNGDDVLDLEMFRQTFETNVFGAVAVVDALLPLLRRSPRGRIVNVSSTMGSLSDQTNPNSPLYGMVMPAYQSSKAALNSVTIALSKRLADTPIKVTSVCPGFVQTDITPINRDQAPLSANEAAEIVIRAATLGDTSPSGTFIDSAGTVAW